MKSPNTRTDGKTVESLASPLVRARIQARLIGDLRRGDPILIKGDTAADDAWLALPLETASEASLAEWTALLGAAVPRALLVSGERAALLATGAMPSPEIRQSGSILLPIAENGTGIQAIIEALQTLAGLTQKPRPFGHHIGLSAPAVLDTVVTLLKRGFLIPAALVWQVPSERIAELEAMAVLTTEAISGDALTDQPVVVRQTASADVPLKLAENCRISVYRTIGDGRDHVAIEVVGKQPAAEIPLVRVHAECFTGDLLGSLRCDCGDQLRGAIAHMAENAGGLLIYTAQEGRDIGLANKMRAYRLQDTGLDTIDANLALGFAADERAYDLVAAILRDMGHGKIRLLTNNPDKIAQLRSAGIDVVERISHHFDSNPHNHAYITAKQQRGGHLTD